jgi:hypothetical protein
MVKFFPPALSQTHHEVAENARADRLTESQTPKRNGERVDWNTDLRELEADTEEENICDEIKKAYQTILGGCTISMPDL